MFPGSDLCLKTRNKCLGRNLDKKNKNIIEGDSGRWPATAPPPEIGFSSGFSPERMKLHPCS